MKILKFSKKNYKLNRKEIALGSVFLWALFLALSFFGFNNFYILSIFGFVALVILPGFLTFIILNLHSVELWGRIGLIVSFSILELMMVGLFANTLLPFLGIANPLSKIPLLCVFSLFILSLLATIWIRRSRISVSFRDFVVFDSKRDLFFAAVPFLLLILIILGAVRLNNGGDGFIVFFSLVAMGIYSAFLMKYNQSFGYNVIPVALFFLSLSLLLMTSLRGWGIVGHDIQKEFHVFQITSYYELWSMGNLKDAYNACLSITILPTIFEKLLLISDPYIYKFLFQIIFAIVPGIFYLTVKQYTSRFIAIASVFYFISFPSFFGDMPMLNRQEIAFLFWSVMLFVLFKESLPLKVRQFIFTIFGCGMVISHYSTTYVVIAILFFLLVFRSLARHLGKLVSSRRNLSSSAIETFSPKLQYSQNLVTIPMFLILVMASFFWSSILTDTSSNSVLRVVMETVDVMKSGGGQESRSGDVLYSLFSWKSVDSNEGLKLYEENRVDPVRDSDPNAFYDLSLYEKYPVLAATGNDLPLTMFGEAIEKYTSISVSDFNYFTRQTSAKLLQLFILLGFFAMLYGKKFFRRPLDTDFVMLATGSLVFILSQIVLPVLSKEYGALRAFQQSLFFLSIFIVIGNYAIFWRRQSFGNYFVGILAILFFFSSTGVFTQFLGGYGPQLHLNNSGTYYDTYYLHSSETAGLEWLRGKGEYQAETHSDRYMPVVEGILTGPKNSYDIYPKSIRKGVFVYLGYTNINKKQASLSYNSDIVLYDYPVEFLDENKDLLYSSKGSRIYK